MPNFASPPAVSLDTENLALRQLGSTWLDEVMELLADPEGNRLTATTATFTREQIAEWLRTRPLQTDRCDWAILQAETGEFAGEVVLNEYRADRNTMNLRIALAGPRWYGRGVGTEAMLAVCEYAFDGLGLSAITLEVLVDNPRALAAYLKVGFKPGRQFNEGKLRFQRMKLDKLGFIETLANREIAKHLPAGWTFAFDSAKRRAGLCSYNDQRISLSRYLAEHHGIDEARQVVWHEVAHGLSGKAAGHGKVWLATAKSLGYRAERFSGTTIAQNTASWVGACPAGHEHYRYRKPTRPVSCGLCSKGFDKRHLIAWQHRPNR